MKESPPQPTGADRAPSVLADAKAVRLLLVADGRCTAPRALELLRAAHWPALEITPAATPAEFDRVLAEHDFDVALIEWSRSPSNALDPLERIQRVAPQLPVVILAEQPCSQAGLCARALRAGAQDALLKAEVTPELLQRSLAFAIERQRARLRAAAQLAQAEEARIRAEHAGHRAAVAASASSVLVATLDYETTLHAVAEQAVQWLADFCIIDLVEEDGRVRREVVAHADPARQSLVEGLLAYPLQRERPHLVSEVLRTREPVLMPLVSRDYLATVAQDARHLALLEQLDVRSHLALPLLARARLLGAILLVRSGGRAPFDADDLATARELADRAALAIDNARLYAEAHEAIAARNSVLRIVAHDLRNPLNAIGMTAEMMAEAPPPAEQIVKRAQLISRAAAQMDRLIQDLLDVVRLDAGQLALDRALVAPERLVHQVVELNAPLATARGLTLTSDRPAEELPPVEVDAQRIVQVLGNLIDNAIKFTPKGGEIEVGVAAKDDEVGFFVHDSGVGMSADDLEHLFRPFWQARRGGREGAGLGLAISRAIVEAHGGRISAESTPGVGSTFHVTLPAAAERRHES
ncbi:MAG TPA: ATP-binding protein [Longimicrobiaceae bacterium]|nr:ATP-binding protein [Longimicrobiaceae bacterium]